MPHRYFTNELAAGRAALTGSDAHHLADVMRAKLGEEVVLCGPDGLEYLGTVTAIQSGRVEFTVTKGTTSKAEPDAAVTLFAGYPKQGKLEEVIRHSVELGVFAALVMVVQGFVGYPVCSLCLKSEAKRVRGLVESGQELKGVTAKIVTDAAPKKRLITYIPDKYNGPNIMMAKVAFFAFLATITANAINGWIASTFETAFSISALIFALIYGIIAKELGFIEENPMKRAGADGFMLVVVTLSIFTNLAQSTPDMVAGMLWPLLVVVVTGSVTFLIISTLVGKIFGVSWQMSCAIGSTCLFGFPGTYIVTNEVVNATATNDEEKQLMLDHMMPKMLIAGMVSVSITSVLIAGYMENLLVF